MMNNTTLDSKFAYLIGVIPFIGLIVGCDDGDHHGTVLDRVREQQVHRSDTTETKQSDQTKRDLPETVPVDVQDDRSFRALARTDQLERYPCSGCHVSDQKIRPSEELNPVNRRAHWKQSLNHGEAEEMDCGTCHGNEPQNQLRTPGGSSVSFDRPDRLCGNCHGQQVRDWKGGSHGKQYRFWQWNDQPVRYNCTTCHDPHDPSFKKRWPATYPSLPDRNAGD